MSDPIKITSIKPVRRPYTPILSITERHAYTAAHRILTTSLMRDGERAMEGGRRSFVLDSIARIIVEEMGDQYDSQSPTLDTRRDSS